MSSEDMPRIMRYIPCPFSIFVLILLSRCFCRFLENILVIYCRLKDLNESRIHNDNLANIGSGICNKTRQSCVAYIISIFKLAQDL
jgi:hypothetical protein